MEGEATGGILTDYLWKDSVQGKAFTVNSLKKNAKLSVLEYSVLDIKDTERGKRSLVRVTLKTGRFHQIRAQFSSRGMPLVGDKKYGSRDISSRTPALFASRLEVKLEGEIIDARRMPELSEYPWNLFEREIYM